MKTTYTLKRPVGRPRIHVPPQLIWHLRNQGLSLRQIAAVTGYGYGSVRRALLSLPASGVSQPRSDHAARGEERYMAADERR